jgi:hypothetical protein
VTTTSNKQRTSSKKKKKRQKKFNLVASRPNFRREAGTSH